MSAYITLRAKNKVTGADIVASIDDAFLKQLADSGREDLALITETLIDSESRIQRERAFLIAALVAIRELSDNGKHDVVRAFSNTVSTLIMDRYRDEILGIIGDDGMQSAAQQVSETLSAVLATLAHPGGAALPKREMEH